MLDAYFTSNKLIALENAFDSFVLLFEKKIK
jgi:hypothetical protein